MSISLVFTAGATIWERLARVAALSPTSHVSIGLGDGQLLHVRHDRGVIIEPRSNWIDGTRVLVEEHVIIPDISEMFNVLKARVGLPYNDVEALYITMRRALPRLAGLFGGDGSDIEGKLARVQAPMLTSASFVMGLDPTNEKILEWAKLDRNVVAPADLLRCAQFGPSFVKRLR